MTTTTSSGVEKFPRKPGDDGIEWLNYLTQRTKCKDTNIDLANEPSEFIQFLHGEPLRWYCEVTATTALTWEQIKTAFETRFGPSKAVVATTALPNMLYRTQGETEDFMSYFYDKMKLIKIHDPKIKENNQIALLKLGLRADVSTSIETHVFSSTRDLCDHMQLVEANQKVLKMLKEEQPPIQQKTSVPPQREQQRRFTGHCFNCGKRGHLQYSCRMPSKNV